jgi:hypothetical protein
MASQKELLKLLQNSKKAIGMTPEEEFQYLFDAYSQGNNFVSNPSGDDLLEMLKGVDSLDTSLPTPGGTAVQVPLPGKPPLFYSENAANNFLDSSDGFFESVGDDIYADKLDDVLANAPGRLQANNKIVNTLVKPGIEANNIDDILNSINKGPSSVLDDMIMKANPASGFTTANPINSITSSAGGAAAGAGGAGGAANAAGKASGLYSKLKGAAGGAGKAIGSGLGKAGTTIGKGLNFLNKAAPVIGGVTQAIDSGVALGDLANSSNDLGELERRLLADSAGGKGLSNLSTEDQRMIQSIRRGNQPYKGGELGQFLGGAGKGLGGAAITGALGLIPGMQFLLPIAAAQLATSGVKGISQGNRNKQGELDALYQRLQQARGM